MAGDASPSLPGFDSGSTQGSAEDGLHPWSGEHRAWLCGSTASRAARVRPQPSSASPAPPAPIELPRYGPAVSKILCEAKVFAAILEDAASTAFVAPEPAPPAKGGKRWGRRRERGAREEGGAWIQLRRSRKSFDDR